LTYEQEETNARTGKQNNHQSMCPREKTEDQAVSSLYLFAMWRKVPKQQSGSRQEDDVPGV
jgi:hypothetical protein